VEKILGKAVTLSLFVLVYMSSKTKAYGNHLLQRGFQKYKGGSEGK
jgi:hypothetical protein